VGSRRIALIVATYNRAGPLDRLLGDVSRQTLDPALFEVVVCVDGSEDRTPEVLASWKAQARFALESMTQKNQGQAVARHQAILASTGQRSVIVDDDMELCPGFLEAHLSAGDEDPERTVVIGKVVPQEGWEKKPLYEAVREQGMMRLHQRLESGEQPPSATAFVTQNVSVPRALYLEVGGFDPSLRLDEDRELGMRLERAGGQLRFAPNAWAVHRSDIGSYEKWERRQYDYGKYALQVWRKYEQDPYLHPLRNLVNGSQLNRVAVQWLSRWDWAARGGSSVLRRLGNVLARGGFFDAGLATHKAILAVQYHLGVKHAVGSWSSLEQLAREFKETPGRPREPTGRGHTVQR
jgi:glycosyltransferase involved in cell wall biosynthesis